MERTQMGSYRKANHHFGTYKPQAQRVKEFKKKNFNCGRGFLKNLVKVSL